MAQESAIRVPGTCRICGCTAARPCEGGCAWADEDRTICTSCAAAPAAAAELPPDLDLEELRERLVAAGPGPVEISQELVLLLLDIAESATGALVELPLVNASTPLLVDPAVVVAIDPGGDGERPASFLYVAGAPGTPFLIALHAADAARALGRRVRGAQPSEDGSPA